ncbi:signal recognition particle-docking protein FtsY, partial [Latilactobacillus sakei]
MGLFDRIKKAFTLEPEKEPEKVDEQATTAEKEADDPAEKSTEKLDDSTGETDSGETPETP